ncbi:MAG: hypothetical protein K2N34_02630 [Lachnospiraceae bacterium]|nr:hypothetical protein [Lachnospiraceae bacterium]
MKKIKLQEMKYHYDYDEITCFEHPVIVLFDFLNPGMGFCYALLSKLRGIYDVGKKQGNEQSYNIREYVLTETEKQFGIGMEKLNRISYKEIIRYLDSDMPVLMGVNLKDIFYSSYYAEQDWVHWFLIKGYKQRGNLLTVLDNTQFEYIGHAYEDFNIPFDLVKSANKSFVKRYGNQDSVLVFKKLFHADVDTIMVYILEEYLKTDLRVKDNYRQNILIKLYSDINAETHTAYGKTNILESSFVNEFRKKLINVNKYRMVFFNGITDYMRKKQFDKNEINTFNLFRSNLGELDKLWRNHAMKSIVKVMHGEKTVEVTNGEIIDLEVEVQKEVKVFLDYLTDIKEENRQELLNKEGNHDRESNYDGNPVTKGGINNDVRFENNHDDIISNDGDLLQGKTVFHFKKYKTYNWWDMDEAPRMIFKKAICDGICLEAGFAFCKPEAEDIGSESKDGSYEAGIFVREKRTGRSFMIGIENNERVVVSQIGEFGDKFDMDMGISDRIFIRENKEGAELGVKRKDGQGEILFMSDKMDLADCEIGITCKTWGNGVDLRVMCEWKWAK